MAIKKTVEKKEKLSPEKDPLFGQVLANMREERAYPEPEWVPHFYASSVGRCARQLSFHLQQAPRVRADAIGRHVMQVGTLVHAGLEEFFNDPGNLPDAWRRVDAEVKFSLPEIYEVPLSGIADLVIHWDEEGNDDIEVIDWKTTATVGFKKKASGSEGPDPSHILQVGMAMRALGADRGRVVYLAKEKMWNNDVKRLGWDDDDPRRIVCEYAFTSADVAEVVDHEIGRLKRINDMFEEGRLAPMAVPYHMPAGARISDPATGAWTLTVNDEDGKPFLADTGKTWVCQYCNWQNYCEGIANGDQVEDQDGTQAIISGRVRETVAEEGGSDDND